MASNTMKHSKIGIVDANGKVAQFYPKGSGMDVIISGNEYGSGNTVQELTDNLAEIAFDKNFEGIDDSSLSSNDKTWSSYNLKNIIANNNIKYIELDNAYNDGCVIICDELTRQGVSTNTKDPNVIVNNINTMANNKYTAAYNTSYNNTKQGNATPADVVQNKTFTAASGVNQIGRMSNYSQSYVGLNPGAVYANGAGYSKVDTTVKCKSPNIVHYTARVELSYAEKQTIDSFRISAEYGVPSILAYGITSICGNLAYFNFTAGQAGTEIYKRGFTNLSLNVSIGAYIASTNVYPVTVTLYSKIEGTDLSSLAGNTIDITYFVAFKQYI